MTRRIPVANSGSEEIFVFWCNHPHGHRIHDEYMHAFECRKLVVPVLLDGTPLSPCTADGWRIHAHAQEPDKAHALAKGGKYVGIPGVGPHQLLETTDAAGVAPNQRERSVVNRLTNFVLFAGRYPITVTVENMRVVRSHDGQTVARQYISRDDLESAEALANRLMRDVEPST